MAADDALTATRRGVGVTATYNNGVLTLRFRAADGGVDELTVAVSGASAATAEAFVTDWRADGVE